jgi:hypothetical protein
VEGIDFRFDGTVGDANPVVLTVERGFLGPNRGVIREGALTPFGDGLAVAAMALGKDARSGSLDDAGSPDAPPL